MAAKRAHHPMHIKRRTRGSSNEISFSVLDAAREARDAEERDRHEGGSGAFKADRESARRYYDAIASFVGDVEHRDGTALLRLLIELEDQELGKRLALLG